jgi:hypothetical protein
MVFMVCATAERLRKEGNQVADWRSCLKAGADAAWATDRGEQIVRAMIAHLRANNVLLPTVAVLERIGLAARARARKKVFEALADGLTAAERYGVLRRFGPRFLKAFDFRSGTPNDPVLAAIELLKGMDRDSTRALPDRPPSTFLPPKWRKLIFANGKADRRLYETAVLATLRERLKGSGIWVAGSRDYRAFEDYLLPAEAVRDTGIGGETDPARYVAGRARGSPRS